MTEVNAQITQVQEPREIPMYALDWRAPIEHLFIGSTPPPVKGKYIDVRGLLKKVQEGDKESLRILLTPMTLQEETRRLKDVRLLRNEEKEEKGSTGIIALFDLDWQIDLDSEKHMSLWVEPSLIDDEGQIKAEWKIWILDNNRKTVNDPALIRGLLLKKNNEQWFRLETVGNEPYKVLKLTFGQ
ncbi:MAG: hypothetical protein Q7R31_02285 [Candidatus Levybacteria bacterium]|nr:hypothetical protein [Candidatus Levybacteria bacterium]